MSSKDNYERLQPFIHHIRHYSSVPLFVIIIYIKTCSFTLFDVRPSFHLKRSYQVAVHKPNGAWQNEILNE